MLVFKPKLNVRNALAKWFVDCTMVGALVDTVAFLVLMGLMKGHGIGQAGESLWTVGALSSHATLADSLKQEAIPIIAAGYKHLPDRIDGELQLGVPREAYSLPQLHWTPLGHLHEPDGRRDTKNEYRLPHNAQGLPCVDMDATAVSACQCWV
jgi:hypothetical protein